MVVKPFTVDLDKPLVFQFGHLGEAYNEWVHQPIVSKEGPRFFANDCLELLTRTGWWVIPLFLAACSILVSLHVFSNGAYFSSGTFSSGWWHLYLDTVGVWFASLPSSYEINKLLGKHHSLSFSWLRSQARYGWDAHYFPPTVTAIRCVPFWNMFRLLSLPSIAPALFGGTLLGYVAYDVTHYYLHHGKPYKRLTQDLKKYHLNHHFRNHSKGFGITSSFWDNVFGIVPSTKTAEKMGNQ